MEKKNVKCGKDCLSVILVTWEKSWEELLALLLTSFAKAKGPQACSPKANGTIII